MRGALAALAVLVAIPAAAQDSAEQASDLHALTNDELGARVNALERDGFKHPCTAMVPVFAELHRRYPRENRYEGMLGIAHAYCAYDEERYAEGMRYLKRVERDNPDRGGFEPLGLYFATQLKDGPEALSRLRGMAASGAIVRLPAETMSWAFRAIREEGLGDEVDAFTYSLATSSAFARMDSEAQDLLSYAALAHAARSGDTSQVGSLLRYVRSPYFVRDLLALREYEPIWPQVERHAGDNMAGLSDDYVTWAATRMADKPEDRDRLSAYSYALLFAGRDREAIALAQGWLDKKQQEGEIEEGDGWALNIQAYAYDALGQPAEADRVFDRLARVSPDEHPWVVNFVINRAARLVELGRWDEGLAASDLAGPVADEHGSPYARMLVASYRACALHKLGRLDESTRALDFVREHFADAPSAGGEALLCADRDDEAAKFIARTLADEVSRPQLLTGMQDDRFSLFGISATSQSKLRQPRDLILARPELRDEALKYVRLLPDRFVPIAYLRRKGLASAPAAD